MKKTLLIVTCLFLLTQTAFCQSQGTMRGSWTDWQTIYEEAATPVNLKVEISFNVSHCDKGALVGYSWWRIRSNFSRPKTWLQFSFDAAYCDGKTQNTPIIFDMSKPGIFKNTDYFFSGYQVVKLTQGVLKDYNIRPDIKLQSTDNQRSLKTNYQIKLNEIRKTHRDLMSSSYDIAGGDKTKIQNAHKAFDILSNQTSTMLNDTYAQKPLSDNDIAVIEDNISRMNNLNTDIDTEIDLIKTDKQAAADNKKTGANTTTAVGKTATPEAYVETDHDRDMRNRANAQNQKDGNADKVMTGAITGAGGAMYLAAHKNLDNEDDDNELSMYLKATIGLALQEIPMNTNTTYNGTNNVSATTTTNHYSINAGLLFSAFNDKMVSARVSPFFTYGLNAFTSGTSGNHTSYGSGAAIGIGHKFKFLIKGEYVNRNGNITQDNAPMGIDAKGKGSYNYSVLKYGAGLFLGFEGHDSFAELSAYNDNISFLKSTDTKVFSYELKISFSLLALAMQYAPNYPAAGGITYPGNYDNRKQDLLLLSLTVPFKIFSAD